MPRISEDDQLAALKKQKAEINAKLDRKIRKLRGRKRSKAEGARVHVGIVVGVGTVEHARRHPGSEVWRLAVRLLEHHHELQPNDASVAAALAELKAIGAGPSALPDAAE